MSGAVDLTLRERQVADRVLAEMSDDEIAADLGISPWTVRAHLRTLAARLGATGRPRPAIRQARDRLSTPPSMRK